MKASDTYCKSLRAVGQQLERRGIDTFELRCQSSDYTIQYCDGDEPHAQLKEMFLSHEEIRSLDFDAARRRGGAFRLVKFERLPEVLRAIGWFVEKRQGGLLKISTVTSTPELKGFQLHYDDRDGRIQSEELRASAMSDLALRMYRIRLHGSLQSDRRI